jgi:predicted RNA-binding protein associated with RNAse of E/G family
MANASTDTHLHENLANLGIPDVDELVFATRHEQTSPGIIAQRHRVVEFLLLLPAGG